MKPGTAVELGWHGDSVPQAPTHPPELKGKPLSAVTSQQIKSRWMGKGTNSPKHPPNLLHLKAASTEQCGGSGGS